MFGLRDGNPGITSSMRGTKKTSGQDGMFGISLRGQLDMLVANERDTLVIPWDWGSTSFESQKDPLCLD